MSDPVSLAGTAVGIVSLGLSVCQGLASYYSQVRDCPKETRNILQKIEGLNDVLEVLEDVFRSHHGLKTVETAAVKTATQNILACKSGLEELMDITEKCEATSAKSGRDLINRMSYPFKRDTIKAILEHVDSLQSNLDTSINILHLSVSSQSSERTAALHSTTEQIQSHIENIEHGQHDINSSISGIEKHLTVMSLHLSHLRKPSPDSIGFSPLHNNREVLNRTTLSLNDTQGVSLIRPRQLRRQKCSCSSLPGHSGRRKGLLASLWDSSHKFGCPLYFHEERSIFERKLSLPNRLFGTSVHICLKSVREAGGYTIFPTLEFCPIVDEEKSPAFQLISNATEYIGGYKGKSPPSDLIRNLINQLRSVYEEGLASPRDTTDYGMNILHKVSYWIENVPESMIEDYRDLINLLVTFGVPLNEQYGFSGTGVLNTLLLHGSENFGTFSSFNQSQMLSMVSDLLACGAELTRSLSETACYSIGAFHDTVSSSILIIHCSSNFLYLVAKQNAYDELHSSDLEKSIILRSERDLNAIISMQATREASIDQDYLAEMCIGWPSGLRIFLNAGYYLNKRKLLRHAIRSRCCESVRLLLNSNDLAISMGHLNLAHEIANSEIFGLVVYALVERRRALQNLAQRHLPVHIRDQLHLPKQGHGVLDAHAAKVFSKLKLFGIQVDPSLEVSQSLRTVYHYIDHDVNNAITLFEAGFQNFEELEGEEELTTLMRVAKNKRLDAFEKYRLRLEAVFETTLFLISKGADPHRRRNEDGRTAMHFLGESIGELSEDDIAARFGMTPGLQVWRYIPNPGDSISPSEFLGVTLGALNHRSWDLLKTLVMDCRNDACSCPCSAQGCLPSTMFIRGLPWWMFPRHFQDVTELIRFLSGRWEPGSVKTLNDTLAPTVLRLCIFEYLELKHTCCLRTDEAKSSYEPERTEMLDDTLHIRDEQRHWAEQVDNLTTFFLSKYHEMKQELPEFLLGYWSIEIRRNPKPDDEEKMREYEQEMEQIRSVGVVLDDSCSI